MRFSILAVITASLGFVAANESKLCVDIQGAFTQVIDLSKTADTAIGKLTPLTVALQGGIVAKSFYGIVTAVSSDTTMLSTGVTADMCTVPSSSKREAAPLELGKRDSCVLGEPEADLVVDILTTFVEVHIALLKTVIGQSGLLSKVPLFGAPVAAALRALESAVDAFAFALISLIPSSRHDAVNAQFSRLTVQVDLAIKSYSLITINKNPAGISINL